MSKLRKSARGQECTVRIPGICSHDKDTVVLAHLPGGGMGGKVADIFGAFCCSKCHSVVDGANWQGKCWPSDTLKLWHLEGVIRTQEIMLREGLIKI